MNLTAHIVRKDLARLRLPIAAWAFLILLKLAWFASISGIWGAAVRYWIDAMNGTIAYVFVGIELVIAYFLVGLLVFEDPVVGRDAFWITRPISGGRLLGAKLAAALLVAVILPVLLHLPWWFFGGFGAADYLPAAGLFCLPYVGTMLVAFASAALTNGFPRFVLWPIAAAAGSVLMYSAAGWAVHKLMPAYGEKYGGPLMAALLLLGVGLAAAAHQFMTRRLRRTLVLLTGGLFVASVAACFFSWRLNPSHLLYERMALERPESPVRLRLDGRAVYQERSGRLTLPLAADEFPRTTATFAALSKGKFSGDVGWNASLYGTVVSAEEAAAEVMKGRFSVPSFQRYQANVRVPSRIVDELAAKSPSFHAQGRVIYAEAFLAGEMPARLGLRKFSGVSFSIDDLSPRRDGMAMVLTQRMPAHPRNPQEGIFSTVIGVKRRQDHALAFANARGQRFAVLAGVRVMVHELLFEGPSAAGSFEDATLFAIGFRPVRAVAAELEIENFQFDRVAGGGGRRRP